MSASGAIFILAVLTLLPYSQGSHLEIPHVGPQILVENSTSAFNVLEHLAGISPYFDSPGVSLPSPPPSSCRVVSAAYLIRHSNIYANDFDYTTYIQPFTEKLANFTNRSLFSDPSSTAPQLSFLANWSTPITNETEQVEKLTPSGASSAKALGSLIASLYPDLIPQDQSGLANSHGSNVPETFNAWSSNAERDIDTAIPFLEGLTGRTLQVVNGTGNTGISVVRISENETLSANTLVPHETCPNFESSSGSNQSATFLEIYTVPILGRFNAAIPSFNFTKEYVFAMQELCGYETVINNSSRFCEVLNLKIGLVSNMQTISCIGLSLDGYGQPLSPTLGIPWLNATTQLLAFPVPSFLPSQSLFFSFTHREEPPFVLTALNLFNNSAFQGSNASVNDTMPTDQINFNRVWKTSNILPFLGHVALERMECSPSSKNSSFIRALVNSAPIPIPDCQSGPAESCPLEEFVAYVGNRSELYGDFVGICGVEVC